ncbi:PCC domain-containing protein [Roseicella frigidaeris]|uniref:DUF296 domain-containing protein n=1 Tax=Roseicella frigidaeris TaxID=2230885 RepID=A0A327M6F3_9PROT|nr:DUF296 domain-containing protein [Roseicella frigidaeris]RAI57946.1 DUF296 domain-containing protein [Roseicella frigidaeris]
MTQPSPGLRPPSLPQPGPVLQPRLLCLPARLRALDLVLPPGASLLQAIAAPLRQAGFASAVLELQGGGCDPFAYVLPAAAPDPRHAAWYSAPHAPPGGAALERACVTFGQRGGAPWVHCHAIWTEAAGRRAGHVLPEETILRAPITARAWGLAGAGFAVAEDAETNFSLFQPATMPGPAADAGADRRALVLRLRPNIDMVAALEEACMAHGFAGAVLRGGVGSLVAPRFREGGGTPDIATELLVTGGGVMDGRGTLEVALADMRGQVHAGRVPRGGNAVCITAELVLEALPG